MNVEAYLRRIGFDGLFEPTAVTLRELHRAHMYSVPFENLDIPLGRPIVLSLPLLFDKVVERRRGGFCYELNALFGWLLKEIGFQVEMLSGSVFHGGAPGPEFDHMLLLVKVGERLIADVGFGESFVEPILLGEDEEQAEFGHGRSYRLVENDDDVWTLQQWRPESEWNPQYLFSLKPRRLNDFHAMCHFLQTSPDSNFINKSFCSLATRNGRITLSNGRLIETSDGHREERIVASAEEYRALLDVHFGIDPGDEADVSILMQRNTPPNEWF